MPDTTSRLGLPRIAASQAQKHVTHNEALDILDGAVQLVLSGIGTETPPSAPAAGEAHVIGDNPSGSWVGHSDEIAHWQFSTWVFVVPKAGWRAWDANLGMMLLFDGTSWVDALQNIEGIGIAAAYDTTNRLTVSSTASLFTNAGAGHQIKINKATSSDTASLLYQSAWNGHAELGLTGDNDFHLKVSSDGQSWIESLTVDADTGTLSGAAVQTDHQDNTADRLMKTGAFGLGATSSESGAIDDAGMLLGNGFYFGSGGAADSATFPSAQSSYEPFLAMNSRIDASTVASKRVFFDGTVPIVGSSPDGGQNWDTPNRLYGQENAVGIVSQSSGLPTGAIIESGENANGQFIRWADGTQICTNAGAAITSDPAVFVGTVTSIDGDKLKIGRWF